MCIKLSQTKIVSTRLYIRSRNKVIKRNFLIYKFTSPSIKSYIGYTSDIQTRYSHHSAADGSNPAFHRAIKKYGGIQNFMFEILAYDLTHKEAKKMETYFIDFWETFGNGYNLTRGGDGGCTRSGKDHPAARSIKLLNMTTKEVILFDCIIDAEKYLVSDNIRQLLTKPHNLTFSRKHNTWFAAKYQDDDTEWDDIEPYEASWKPIIMANIETRQLLSFKSITFAAQSLNVNATRISSVLRGTGRHKQVIVNDDRYDVQYDPPTREWNWNIDLNNKVSVIGFDQDYSNDNPICRFDSLADAANATNTKHYHVSSSARHERWHAGKINNKKIRWEFECIDKRNAQNPRPKSANMIFYINKDGNKISFTNAKAASEETHGSFNKRTQTDYIRKSAKSPDNAKIPCKSGLIWYYDK